MGEGAESNFEKKYESYFADLEYGPGIVEKLKAKFGRISTGSSKRRKNHKRLANG